MKRDANYGRSNVHDSREIRDYVPEIHLSLKGEEIIKLKTHPIINVLKEHLKREKSFGNNIVIHYDLDHDRCLRVFFSEEKIPVTTAYALITLGITRLMPKEALVRIIKEKMESLSRRILELEKTIFQLENKMFEDSMDVPFLQNMLEELMDMLYELQEKKTCIESAYKLLTLPETAYEYIPARLRKTPDGQEILVVREKDLVWSLPFQVFKKKITPHQDK